jgi:hypothetical protein
MMDCDMDFVLLTTVIKHLCHSPKLNSLAKTNSITQVRGRKAVVWVHSAVAALGAAAS